MDLRNLARLALVLTVVGVLSFSPTASSATAQSDTASTPRTQKRLTKQSVLKAGLRGISPLQDASGGFAAPRTPVDPRATADVVSMMIALRNAGVEVDLDAAVAYVQQTDPVAFVDSQGVTLTDSEVAKIVMALVAAGGDPHNVGGNDLVARIAGSWHEDTGIYGGAFWEIPFVVMALVVTGESYEEKVIDTFAATQLEDGSWSAYGTAEPGSGDARTTAWIVEALVAAGRGDDEMVAKAIGYFPTVQGDDGSFGSTPDSTPDAWTTGFVISALIAAGENLKSEPWSRAVDGLLTFQNDDGTFRQYPEKEEIHLDATIVALVALAGAYWPVVPTT
jgi:hypothetical protein